MNRISFIIFYLIGNLLSTYVINQFYKIFFKDEQINNKRNFVVYSCYFLMTSIIYLVFNRPLLTFITNLLCLFLITLLYQSTFLKKIVAVGLVYGISLFVESVVFLIDVSLKMKYVEIVSLFLSRIILLIFVHILHTNHYLKQDIHIPKIQLLVIFAFPFGSIILFQLLVNISLSKKTMMLVTSILLVFNLLIFYIFDYLNNEYIEVLKAKEKEFENDFYLRERQIYTHQIKVNDQQKQILQTIQHDLKGHCFTLNTLLENNQIEEAKRYLERIQKTIQPQEMYVDTGNMVITSIFNYYIQQALNENISIQYDIKIPQELKIDTFDLSTILINLFNNALEAALKSKEKEMKIRLFYERNVFYLFMENSYQGTVLKKENKFISTKGKENHGFGIESVKKCVERYRGDIEFEINEKSFKAYIMLYVDEKL